MHSHAEYQGEIGTCTLDGSRSRGGSGRCAPGVSSMHGRGPLFSRLADHKYFTRFLLDGESIEWPNGASIAPETLHDAVSGAVARRAAGRRTRNAS